MTDVDRLLQQYISEHQAGGSADPLEYLDRVEGTDRLELEALIDGYLAHAPPRRPSPEDYRGSLSEQIVESLSPSITGSSGLWPTVLPRLRNRAQVKRADLVARMAARLGVAGRETKVADYYNQMEQGRLPAQGVSARVLEALGEIVGQSAESLRRLGRATGPAGQQPAGAAPAFTRRATGAPPPEPMAYDLPAETAAPPAPATPEWDEVDQLFRGGD